MAKTRVKTRFDIAKLFDQGIPKRQLDSLGRYILKEMKRLIAASRSTVKGGGRFQRYSDSYTTAIRKRYANIPRGKTTKVNLELTGKMLENLMFRMNKKNTIKVGILSNAPKDVKVRARVHNDGEGNAPQRKFIPDKRNDEFAVSIQRIINTFHQNFLNKSVIQSNRRRRR